ncbi:MAG: hypothetical protein IK085_04835 [Clostridia bacterium]|nr:hypothetical protein [Clostridia bacterium]
MNVVEWIKENYPQYANCEKKPLPHVDYEIISIRQLTDEEYKELKRSWDNNNKRSKNMTEDKDAE